MTKGPSREVLAIIAESGIEAKVERRLVYHPESDCVFETHTDLEWEACAAQGCDDVTGDKYFEEMFKNKDMGEEEPEPLLN